MRETLFKKGEEMAYFTFGSTVVLLFEKRYDRSSAGIKEWTRASSWSKK